MSKTYVLSELSVTLDNKILVSFTIFSFFSSFFVFNLISCIMFNVFKNIRQDNGALVIDKRKKKVIKYKFIYEEIFMKHFRKLLVNFWKDFLFWEESTLSFMKNEEIKAKSLFWINYRHSRFERVNLCHFRGKF